MALGSDEDDDDDEEENDDDDNEDDEEKKSDADMDEEDTVQTNIDDVDEFRLPGAEESAKEGERHSVLFLTRLLTFKSANVSVLQEV